MEKRMHVIYEECKDMGIEQFTELLNSDMSIEEKEFYVLILEFFMQKRQEKIINRK